METRPSEDGAAIHLIESTRKTNLHPRLKEDDVWYYYGPNKSKRMRFKLCGDCNYKTYNKSSLVAHVEWHHPSSMTALQRALSPPRASARIGRQIISSICESPLSNQNCNINSSTTTRKLLGVQVKQDPPLKQENRIKFYSCSYCNRWIKTFLDSTQDEMLYLRKSNHQCPFCSYSLNTTANSRSRKPLNYFNSKWSKDDSKVEENSINLQADGNKLVHLETTPYSSTTPIESEEQQEKSNIKKEIETIISLVEFTEWRVRFAKENIERTKMNKEVCRTKINETTEKKRQVETDLVTQQCKAFKLKQLLLEDCRNIREKKDSLASVEKLIKKLELFKDELEFEVKALQKEEVDLSEDIQKAEKSCYAMMHALDALIRIKKP